MAQRSGQPAFRSSLSPGCHHRDCANPWIRYVSGTYYIAFAANQMIFKLIEVFDRFLALPSTYYDQNSSGHLVAKLTYHVTQVTGAATDAVKILFREGSLLWVILVIFSISTGV